MRIRQARQRCASMIQRWLPRLLALYWAKWAVQTTIAYVETVPPQLVGVDSVTPVPLWLIWIVPAIMLALGVAIPPKASARSQNVARGLRIGGTFLLSIGLIVWTAAFYLDPPRGWVSAKNYEALAVMVAFTSWFIARDETGRKQVVRE